MIRLKFMEKSLIFIAILLAWASLAGAAMVHAEDGTPIEVTPKQLKVAAANSLWRLKHAIEKEGFYSARTALNVWRSNAEDAGTFDPAEYEEYKRLIYEKSIRNSLNCYQNAIQDENRVDARICLYTWKTRTEEMGIFDPELFEKMSRNLK